MLTNLTAYKRIQSELADSGARLVAVSKTKSPEAISELYEAGQRDFGENYVQELSEKHEKLPVDINWHFIGHLQRNKVKQIAPFVHMIHGTDSLRLLEEINKQASLINRKVNVLLQVYISKEDTKFGLDESELFEIIELVSEEKFPNIVLRGLMGMASLTDDSAVINIEFGYLHSLYKKIKGQLAVSHFDTLSMGMTSDYLLALKHGSTMIRIGSALFGERVKQ